MEEDKKAWTLEVGRLIKQDVRSHLTRCEYFENYRPGMEVVELEYKGGSVSRINVTHNSLGAILSEIVEEVYGSGARGRFFRGWPYDEEGETR